ncbi:MAG: NAD-dependent succinate-semialdehyde dehydrogenase [Bdellovibrionales bacterium]|nr:NAD-dependent succinate-semialdehyde dehydrogenase [Bdellovibrionales bacterium]
MSFHTLNPFTQEILKGFNYESDPGITEKLRLSHQSFCNWKNKSINERNKYFINLIKVLEKNKNEYAITITNEMGKSLKESLLEVEKCKSLIKHYIDNGEKYLKPEIIEADGNKHYIVFEPLGVILSIMPWNFPFWQALRFAIPTIMAGNTTIVKSAEETTQSGICIENAFLEAGFPEGVYQSLLASHEQIETMMKFSKVAGVSFTGSTRGGTEVYSNAAKSLKKVVLELGGSDPFIVLEDAELDKAVQSAVFSKLLNAGQTCIAAKRFLVHEKIYDLFLDKFTNAMQEKKVGDPCMKDIDLGPLYSSKGVNTLLEQVQDAKNKGASIHCGGKLKEEDTLLFLPTVISEINPEMKISSEEVFGPVACVYKFADEQQAVTLANNTKYGLGASVWGRDFEKINSIVKEIDCGAVFVNSIVKSDPRVPFGGIKLSGIGRELGEQGIKEFVNIKSLNYYLP